MIKATFIVLLLALNLSNLPVKSETSSQPLSLEQVVELADKGEYTKVIEIATRFINSHEEKSIEHAEWLDICSEALWRSNSNSELAINYSEQALKIRKSSYGQDSEKLSRSYFNIASAYETLGEYDKSIEILNQIIVNTEKVYGKSHIVLVDAYGNMGLVLRKIGRFEDSIEKNSIALEIILKINGRLHSETAAKHSNLGVSLKSAGQFDKATKHYKEALSILEEMKKTETWVYATTLNNYASILSIQGKSELALEILYKSLNVREKMVGVDHPSLKIVHSNIAGALRRLGEYEKAYPFNLKSLELFNKTNKKPNHPTKALLTRFVAKNLIELKRYEEAEKLLHQAVEIYMVNAGKNRHHIGSTLDSLATIKYETNNYEQAVIYFNDALSNLLTRFDETHPNVSNIYLSRGWAYYQLELVTEATSDAEKAFLGYKSMFGSESLEVSKSLHLRAMIAWSRNEKVLATQLFEKSWSILENDLDRPLTSHSASINLRKLSEKILGDYLEIVFSDRETNYKLSLEQQNSIIEKIQHLHSNPLNQNSELLLQRLNSTSSELSSLIKKLQNNAVKLKTESAKLKKLAKRSKKKKDVNKQSESIKIVEQFRNKEKKLATDIRHLFPSYANQIGINALSINDIQASLTKGESVYYFMSFTNYSYAWMITKDQSQLRQLSLTKEKLKEKVLSIRTSISLPPDGRLKNIKPFDIASASFLYEKLLSPFNPLLKDIEHLNIVGDAHLFSLPLGLLVTEKEAVDTNLITEFTAFGQYKKIPWLTKRFSISRHASLNVLTNLNKNAVFSKGEIAFLGFGDPVLSPLNRTSYLRSQSIPFEDIGSLPDLPHTSKEINSMAAFFEMKGADIYLREQATETRLKNLKLSKYRNIAFSTHSVQTIKTGGTLESSLVLTPPAKMSNIDDGILSSSEIVNLDLDADLVILSACSTGLLPNGNYDTTTPSLVQAFIFAGSRSLLVSHWDIESEAAHQLMTGMFEELKVKNNQIKAKALQLSMLKMIEEGSPYQAHPAFWAAFSLIGNSR